jgi:hypothetical protein
VRVKQYPSANFFISYEANCGPLSISLVNLTGIPWRENINTEVSFCIWNTNPPLPGTWNHSAGIDLHQFSPVGDMVGMTATLVLLGVVCSSCMQDNISKVSPTCKLDIPGHHTENETRSRIPWSRGEFLLDWIS